jgi:hypothetical protein
MCIVYVACKFKYYLLALRVALGFFHQPSTISADCLRHEQSHHYHCYAYKNRAFQERFYKTRTNRIYE